MMNEDRLDEFEITSESMRKATGGRILSGARVQVRSPSRPARYLCHGWQSWSLSAWVPFSSPLPPPRPALLHPVHTDPRYARLLHHHGSFYGAVELLDGTVLFLGSLELSSHVEFRDGLLIGSYEAGSGDWFFAVGEESQIFAHYVQLLGERFGRGGVPRAPRVWCSWYSLYTQITEPQLRKILADQNDLPFDVFQIDDGWQKKVGDWEANEKFPSGMAALADTIKRANRTAGLWLAPLLVVPSAPVYRDHPSWILRDEKGTPVSAGINWDEPLYALDTTHPEVLLWLAALMKKVRGWGYDYVKLDFLYAGALPGVRYKNAPREVAYRQGLKTLRDALGDAYLLTCGAPILPSLGLCDGLRIGPDVAGHWESALESRLLQNFATPGVRNAVRTSLHRLWLQPIVNTDPDVTYFSNKKVSLTPEERRLLQDLAIVCGFRATSDLPSSLTQQERAALREFLSRDAKVERIFRSAFSVDGRVVDFASAATLPPPAETLFSIAGRALGELASIPGVMRMYLRMSGRIHDFRFSE